MRYYIYLQSGVCLFTENEKFVDSVIEAKNSGSDKPVIDTGTRELVEIGEVVAIHPIPKS